MADKTLRQWSEDNNVDYHSSWRMFSNNQIKGAYKTTSGRILIKELTPEKTIESLIQANGPNKSDSPTIKIENISMASDVVTRSNRAGDAPIINRFSNIDEGVVPWVAQSGAYNRSGILIRDCVILCQKAFFNVAIFSQIIRLLVYLGNGKIRFKGGNKKSRKFFEAYFKKIGLDAFQIQWFLEFWRSGNVFTFSYNKLLTKEDVDKITSVYGLESNAAKKVNIPSQFTIINPADVQVGTYSMYIRPIYYKVIAGYELEVLKNPKNEADQEVFDSLPDEVKQMIKKGARSVTIPLDSENLIASFFFKQPYEGLAIPPFFSALDDINWKLQLRKMDIALTRMLNQAILLVTTGAPKDEGGINYNNITLLQDIFKNESVGRVLIHDYTTKAQFVIPDIASILDPKKYEAVNNDIYIGLNYILLQGEKFANKQTALQLFIENVEFSRKIFINDFLSKIIEKVSKELGFKSYPEPYFDEISISNQGDFDRIVTQLAQIGQLTPEEVYEALESGRLPANYDESLDKQRAFKEFRDEGLYQPVIGGPANQMEQLQTKNDNAIEMQENQHQHDDKQKMKDRKFNKDNPQTPAPQIVLNAPTKLSQPTGRPKGTGTPQKTKKVRPIGASTISGTKVIENAILYSKLQHDVIASIQEKFNIKSLNDNQINMAEELTKMIVRNEDPKEWAIKEIIGSYIDKPIDKNIDRVEKVEEVAAYHNLESHLASILYASIKEENKEEENDKKV